MCARESSATNRLTGWFGWLVDARGVEPMRFKHGQVYESVDGGGQAIVIQARGGGRAGLLRFMDTGAEEWRVWSELNRDGEWQLKDDPD